MKIKEKRELLFRKAYIPWYDTEPVLMVVFVFALLVLLFSFYGIAAAFDTLNYRLHVWVPLTLGALALILLVATLVRLLRRSTSGGPE